MVGGQGPLDPGRLRRLVAPHLTPLLGHVVETALANRVLKGCHRIEVVTAHSPGL